MAERGRSAEHWREVAQRAEALGYDTLLMPDHITSQLAPVAALAAAAAATTTLRIGSFVFDNDYRNPVMLAKEATTLDLLSGGRLEFGIGAGWNTSDYRQLGIPYDTPKVRVDRMEEAVALIKRLWTEEKVTHDVQKKGLSVEQAFADMKDAIRYTLQYPEDKYTAGVQADAQRLKDEGAEYVDSRNTWTSEQYKGINSWWREGDSGQLFEVQFHTQASFDAKQETHAAYERLRTLPEDTEEVRDLRAYQRQVNAKIPVPPGAPDIVII